MSGLSDSYLNYSFSDHQFSQNEYTKKLKDLADKPLKSVYIVDDHVLKTANSVQIFVQKVRGFLKLESKTDPIKVKYELLRFLHYGEVHHYFDDQTTKQLVSQLKDNLEQKPQYKDICETISSLAKHPLQPPPLDNEEQILFGLKVYQYSSEHDHDLKKTYWSQQIDGQISSAWQKILKFIGLAKTLNAAPLDNIDRQISLLARHLKEDNLEAALKLFNEKLSSTPFKDLELLLINSLVEYEIAPITMSQFYLGVAAKSNENGVDLIKKAALYKDSETKALSWIVNPNFKNHLSNLQSRQPFIDYLKYLVTEKSDLLIEELILNPDQESVCETLIETLNQIEDQPECFSVANSIVNLKKIAASLREGDSENFDKITQEIVGVENQGIFQDASTAALFTNLAVPRDLEKIRQMPNSVIRIRTLALLISRDKIPMQDLNLTAEEIVQIGPHLTFFELNGDLPSVDSFEEFLKTCIRLKTLKLTSCSIEKIPDLESCKVFELDSCKNLKSIGNLTNCERFDCKWCSKLKFLFSRLDRCKTFILRGSPEFGQYSQIPDLPLCEEFNCSTCSIKKVPELKECKKFSLMMCNKLYALPDQLPKCETFACIDCPIDKVPDLYKCKGFTCARCPIHMINFLSECESFNCDSCPYLEGIIYVPNCLYFSCHNCPIRKMPELSSCKMLDFSGSPHVPDQNFDNSNLSKLFGPPKTFENL